MVGYTINTFLSVIHPSIGPSLIYNETHFTIAHDYSIIIMSG